MLKKFLIASLFLAPATHAMEGEGQDTDRRPHLRRMREVAEKNANQELVSKITAKLAELDLEAAKKSARLERDLEAFSSMHAAPSTTPEEKVLGAVGGAPMMPAAPHDVAFITDEDLRAQPDIRQYTFVPDDAPLDVDNLVDAHGPAETLKKNSAFMEKLVEYTRFGKEVAFFSELENRAVNASRGLPSTEYSRGQVMLENNVRSRNAARVKELNAQYDALYEEVSVFSQQSTMPDLPEPVYMNATRALITYGYTPETLGNFSTNPQSLVNALTFVHRDALFLESELNDHIPTEEEYEKRARAVVKVMLDLDDADLVDE